MVTAAKFRAIALALDGTVAAPHFDRTAFKVARTYATLAADGLSANLKFSPDTQALKCLTAPEAFAPVAGGWGRMGWTTVTLAAVSADELAAALDTAWRDAQPKPRSGRKSARPQQAAKSRPSEAKTAVEEPSPLPPPKRKRTGPARRG